MEVTLLSGPSALSPMSGRGLTGSNAVEHRRLARAVSYVNSNCLFGESNELTFAKDAETDRMVVKIINRDTKEVVQQLPPEYVLRLAEEAGR